MVYSCLKIPFSYRVHNSLTSCNHIYVFGLAAVSVSANDLEQHQWDHCSQERETGVLSPGLMELPVYHACVSVISHQGWKWPVKSKLVLLEASSMSVLIPALLPLGPQPRFYFVLLPLSPTLPVDVACASSTERRKPKTGGILLKGVSQQPDINNLRVCGAESKPMGFCGFTWVCAHASVCAPTFTLCVQRISSCITSPVFAINHSCLIWYQIS